MGCLINVSGNIGKECQSITLENEVKSIFISEDKVYDQDKNFYGYIAKHFDDKIVGIKPNGQEFEILLKTNRY